MPWSHKRVALNRACLVSMTAMCVILFSSCLLPYAISVSKESAGTPTSAYADSRFEQVGGILLHHRVNGSATGAGNILLIHGLGGSTYSFDRVVAPLATAGYMTVSVDLPGFGYSGRPGKFDHSQLNRARLLWLLLDRIDTGPWIILGHSMGGGTAVAMGLLRPSQTRTIILVAPALEDWRGIASSLLAFPPFSRWLQIYLERSVITEDRIARILGEAYGRAPTEQEILAYLEPLQASGTARSLVSMARSSRSVPFAQLAGLRMPVFAIWGADDRIVPLAKARDVGSAFPDFRLVIMEGTGHIPMEHDAGRFVPVLLDILGSADRERDGD